MIVGLLKYSGGSTLKVFELSCVKLSWPIWDPRPPSSLESLSSSQPFNYALSSISTFSLLVHGKNIQSSLLPLIPLTKNYLPSKVSSRICLAWSSLPKSITSQSQQQHFLWLLLMISLSSVIRLFRRLILPTFCSWVGIVGIFILVKNFLIYELAFFSFVLVWFSWCILL